MYHLLDQRLQYLPGVGPNRALTLASELDIHTVKDLLFHFPYRYIDRSTIYTVSQLPELRAEDGGVPYVQLKGRISDVSEEGVGRSHRLEALFSDDTGSVRLVWFAGISYIKKSLRKDAEYLLLGKPALFNLAYSITHPELELANGQSSMVNGQSSTVPTALARYHPLPCDESPFHRCSVHIYKQGGALSPSAFSVSRVAYPPYPFGMPHTSPSTDKPHSRATEVYTAAHRNP